MWYIQEYVDGKWVDISGPHEDKWEAENERDDLHNQNPDKRYRVVEK